MTHSDSNAETSPTSPIQGGAKTGRTHHLNPSTASPRHDFPGAKSRRTGGAKKPGKDTQATDAELAAWIRSHWCVENRLHWVRDVTFDENRSQVRTGNGPRVMASLRNLAISIMRLTGASNIAQALRHHAWDPLRPVALLLTS